MSAPRQKDAGFSLIETLLGLTLTALIGMLMMGSMQMGTRVWERDKATVQPGTQQLVLGQVAEWLGRSLSAKVRNYDEPMYAPFHGEEHSVTFLYPAANLGGAPGFYTIKLDLVETDTCKTGRDLYLEMTRDVISDNRAIPEDVKSERRRLIACIDTPSFIFWGEHMAGGQLGWYGNWVNEPQLPSVVKLRSIGADGFERALMTQEMLSALH